ncbi:MAG: group II intron reverse transcriptase/maturase [Clostridia bacterium]
MAKQKKLRHLEYYDLQDEFDKLYADSKNGKVFTDLMELISNENNIKLAYRNIKSNSGSNTCGVDKRNIGDIEILSSENYIKLIQNKLAWYKSKPVKRVEIPKPNGKMRPLGIPTIIDRLVQQCVLQVLEPICEAKFHERNNGFRPNRSTEHAIAQCYRMIQKQHLHFVVDIDIKGFFDNVNHSKLIKQMWNLGIRDKKLICIIKEMLTAEIVMPNGEIIKPTKGTQQGGIISPLLSNIVLNELDWWITSQWERMPTHNNLKEHYRADGSSSRGYICRVLRETNLKEMYIVRYADDFKVFCKNRQSADKIFIATKDWLLKRLKLEISPEKSKVINLKKKYSEFLGIRIKAVKKANKYVVYSNMTKKAFVNESLKLKEQIKCIQHSKDKSEMVQNIKRYNSMIWGIHNYYRYATNINIDCGYIQFRLNKVIKNRLGKMVKKNGKNKRKYIQENYGKSEQIRFICDEPLCPIGYIQTKNPMYKKRTICKYTCEGREEIHKNLKFSEMVMKVINLLGNSYYNANKSIEFYDNRISLYSAQKGKCAVTGKELWIDEIHCHHKLPVSQSGSDKYKNLVIVHEDVHRLIHATNDETIAKYRNLIKPTKAMLSKINEYRVMANNSKI